MSGSSSGTSPASTEANAATPDTPDSGTAAVTGVATDAATGAAIGSAIPGVGTAIGAAVGAGIGIWGALSSASDQNALDQEKAHVAQEQATEITAREAANEINVNENAYRQKLQFGASYAGSGKSGVGVGSQLEIQRQADLQNMMSNRESQFQVQMLQQQAGVDTTLGAETMTAGDISALGQGVKGATTVGSIMNPNTPAPVPWG